ncbi:Purine permease 3 [Striga hermonthica]|uniref:Probable purine permease n=1 Tax=Striga hermonthica TaxID=68872 RepID=A0A9N7NU47_STRHE|nr:Purine permease 3 [Striga hermonthica]
MDIQTAAPSSAAKTAFLIINCLILAVGNTAGPLIMRLYFIHGGKRIWFSSWLESGGFPVILIPLAACYARRRRVSAGARLVLMDLRLFAAAAVIGALTGLDNYLFAYGIAKLPVSTSTLIIASQLAFTAAFAFLIVRQRFTAFSVNSVVLLTVGAAVLGLHTKSDRPPGETSRQYWVGFFMTVAASALYGFILPLVELTYKRTKKELTYALVLEIQLVMSIFATAFSTVGMLINHDFQALAGEAKAYGLGESIYYVVVVWGAILWQCFFLGAIGVIFYSSSLVAGIVMTVVLPVTEVLAVIFFKEKFQAEKGISLFLSLWGFFSYFYGDIKHNKKRVKNEIGDENENEGEARLGV